MTSDQYAVLSHVVVDPDAWMNHAVMFFGEDQAENMLIEKVAKYQKEYLLAVTELGNNYKSRAQIEAESFFP